MSYIKLNGVDIDAIVATAENPSDELRDIGVSEPAADGTMYVTRTARKFDNKFKSIPLSLSDALIWTMFLTGEGEVWNFDSSLYGCKGTGPSANTGGSQTAGSSKYGAGKLSLTGAGGIAWAAVAVNSWGKTGSWTICVWRNSGSGFTHYVVNSSGQKWVDGVRNDAASTTWLSVGGDGTVTISNTSGTITYDDLVVVPYVMPTAWPPQVYAAAVAYSTLPYLEMTGDFVAEQTSRTVSIKVTNGGLMKVGGGTVMKTIEMEFSEQ